MNDKTYAEEEAELRKEYESLRDAIQKNLEKEVQEKEVEVDKEIKDKQEEEQKKTTDQHIKDIQLVENLAKLAIQNFKDKTAQETRARCSKTTAKQGAVGSISKIKEEVDDEYGDDDEDDEDDDEEELSGGNIANLMYQINKRYVMNSPIESSHKTHGNASKKVMMQKVYGGRVRPVRTGLAGLAISAIELVIDLWGDQIKNFFQNVWNDVQEFFKTPAQKEHERRQREEAERAAAEARKQVIISRIVALYKIAMIEAADELFDTQSNAIETQFDTDFDAYKDAMEAELDAYLDELQDQLEDELDELEEKADDKLDELDAKADAKKTEIEKEEERKREEDKQALIAKKNQELAQQNALMVIPPQSKSTSMTTSRRDQTRHNEIQTGKATEELKNEGNLPIEGKGKKINNRAEIVKKIMKKKGLSMIEASKYVKSHNLY